MTYESESQALDGAILPVVEAWHRRDETLQDSAFNDLALRLLAYQLRYNAPYARYCARLGITAWGLGTSAIASKRALAMPHTCTSRPRTTASALKWSFRAIRPTYETACRYRGR